MKKGRTFVLLLLALTLTGAFALSFADGAAVPVAKITVSDPAVLLAPDTTWQLHPMITPENASNREIAWSSSNEQVARVNPNGMIIGYKPGKCTVTGLAADGSGSEVKVSVQVDEYDLVILEPGEISVDFATTGDNVSSVLQIGSFISRKDYKRDVTFTGGVVESAGECKLIPVKPGPGAVECVVQETDRGTVKSRHTVYVAQSVFDAASDLSNTEIDDSGSEPFEIAGSDSRGKIIEMVLNKGTAGEDAFFGYFLPAGSYSITNLDSEKAIKVIFCKNEKQIKDGREEYKKSPGNKSALLFPGKTNKFNLAEDEFIRLNEKADVRFEVN